MSSTAILDVEDVHLSFEGLRAVSGASFEVKTGSICALIGPNGAGKTTLFNVISGFYRADRGRIALDGVSILGRPPHAVANAARPHLPTHEGLRRDERPRQPVAWRPRPAG